MTIKVLTFSKVTGKSETAVIESDAREQFSIMDAVRRLVNDVELESSEILSTNNHSMKKLESDQWIIIITV